LTRIIVDPVRPDPDALARAATILRGGGVAAVPTDTLYGLAADPFNVAAVDRVFAIKGRMNDQALPLVAADSAQVREWIGGWSVLGDRLAGRFWPGPLTLVLPAPPTLASAVTGGRGTVGVRVPAHAVTRALCAAVGRPLTATSANRSGAPATEHPDVVAAALGLGVDVLVDAGATPGGPPSTIVDISTGEPRLIRAGAVSWDAVHECAQNA
jgi:L-threonylcarbamoyladenylate synthase